jgi:hypothetical protein
MDVSSSVWVTNIPHGTVVEHVEDYITLTLEANLFLSASRWQKIEIRIEYLLLRNYMPLPLCLKEYTHIAYFWIYAKFSTQPTSEVIMLPT